MQHFAGAIRLSLTEGPSMTAPIAWAANAAARHRKFALSTSLTWTPSAQILALTTQSKREQRKL